MEPVETRELAYFVAVAEEMHFGRAARRLGIAQPPLSRAIRQLERRIGATLIERRRPIALTAAGEVLLREGRPALAAVTAAVRRTQRAAGQDDRLVLAMKPGGDAGLLPGILAAYRRMPDAFHVEVVCSVWERAAMLRDGRADVALLHGPWEDLSGLATEELLVEDQVVVVPQGHRLAERTAVRLADLEGETTPRWPHMPAGSTEGPEVTDAGQLMQLIALGETVAVVPRSVRGHLRQDLVAIPIIDAPPTTLLVAWPEAARSRALAAFVHAATATADEREDEKLLDHAR